MRLPARLSKRSPQAHKGDFGHVFILAGSSRFSGAAVLCAEGALRSGAGLVTLGIPRGINAAVIRIKPKEVMTLPLAETREGALSPAAYPAIMRFIEKADVVAVGPGVGQGRGTQQLVRRLVYAARKPLVVDADGLNAIAGHLKKFARAVLTPHAGEMARLTGSAVAAAPAARKAVAKEFAKYYNVTIVLKGHRTIVADCGGKTYVNTTGNPGMATAGSGDVLTGMIAAFIGQGLDDFSAAKYAVYLHGLAGDLAARKKTQIAMIASDIIAHIPAAIRKCI